MVNFIAYIASINSSEKNNVKMVGWIDEWTLLIPNWENVITAAGYQVLPGNSKYTVIYINMRREKYISVKNNKTRYMINSNSLIQNRRN